MVKHRKSRRHRRRGGSASAPQASSYSSATTYGSAVNGTGDSQYTRVFGPNSSFPANGNAIIGVQGQRAGRRRRKHSSKRHSKRKSYRGGFMGGLMNAIVPATLIGMQRYFTKKYKK